MIRAVNLIPAQRLKARQRRRRVERWTAGTLSYGLALVGVSCVLHLMSVGGERAVATELEQTRAKFQAVNAAIEKIQPKLAEAQTTLVANRSIGGQPDWSILLALLAELLGDDAMLVSCELKPLTDDWSGDRSESLREPAKATMAAQYLLRLAGLGQTQAAVSNYLLRLEQTGLFESVSLIETSTVPFHTGSAVAMRIECVLSERWGDQP